MAEKPIRRRGRVWVALIAAIAFVVGGITTKAIDRYVPLVFQDVEGAVGYEPLTANVLAWPAYRICDFGTAVAMGSGNLSSADQISPSAGDDFRNAVVTAGGGSYLVGHLTIAVATRDASTVQVVGLKPRIYRKIPEPPTWVSAAAGGGCGGIDIRVFEVNLDKNGTVVDKGIQQATEVGDPTLKKQSLGTGFTVSATDQTQIVTDVISCKQGYEWGVDIEYLSNGKLLTKRIGHTTQPWRSMGKRSDQTKVFGIEYREDNSGVQYAKSAGPDRISSEEQTCG